MQFTIKRSTWCNYDTNTKETLPEKQPSQLVREDGHQCCLGFYLEACGVDRGAMLGLWFPSLKIPGFPETAHWLVGNGLADSAISHAALALVAANDSPKYAHSREARVTELFKKQGIDVTFED
jgi:hypothetical protein